jgi:hypothetical protein
MAGSFGGAVLRLAALLELGSAQTRLEGHSLSTPPNIYRLASDWFLGGTVIPSGRSLVLQPGVPGRSGFGWSSSPLLTDDFEATFKFTSKSPEKRTVKEDGFAFWYVYENTTEAHYQISVDSLHNQDQMIANTWQTAFDIAKMDMFAYRSQYNGLGVFFCDDASSNPTVSALANNGNMPYKLGLTVPSQDAMKFDWRGGKEVTIKVRVQPTKATVSIEGGPSYEVKSDFKSGGYMGFSTAGGKKGSMDTKERSDTIEIIKLDVMNHGSGKGEELKTVEEKPVSGGEDLLAATSSFRAHRDESAAIKDLTNMVFKLVVESQPMRKQMLKAIDTLGRRITVMEATFESLKKELDKKTGHKLGDEFANLKKELTSLTRVATSETEERHKRLESLHTDLSAVHSNSASSDVDKHLDRLADANRKTLENLNQEQSRMFGVSVSAIIFIGVAGLALYNKFRGWEKKHVL